MIHAAEKLLQTVTELKTDLTPQRQAEIRDLLIQFERYLRTAYASDAPHKKGAELAEPLDAALKTAILLLENIDAGTVGPDDEIARQLKELYTRFLGPLRL